jgi:hypothetical protein
MPLAFIKDLDFLSVIAVAMTVSIRQLDRDSGVWGLGDECLFSKLWSWSFLLFIHFCWISLVWYGLHLALPLGLLVSIFLFTCIVCGFYFLFILGGGTLIHNNLPQGGFHTTPRSVVTLFKWPCYSCIIVVYHLLANFGLIFTVSMISLSLLFLNPVHSQVTISRAHGNVVI